MQKRSNKSRNPASARLWTALVCCAGLLICLGAPILLAAKVDAASPAGAAAKQSEVAGRYNIFREGGKDTGCMLTLDDKAKGKGGNKATLAPACRDQGLVIFDPVGWRIINGHLVLTARKGHTTQLGLEPDGTWLKDPKEGKSLSLKKQ